MSIFERFVSKEAGGQERKAFHPTPYRRMFSELETTGGELKEQYPDDFKTVESFIEYASTVNGEIYVIGGGEIYAELLPYCDRAIITRVYERFGGDTFFTDIDGMPEWELAETSPVIETNCHKIRFMLYLRRGTGGEQHD